jgi:hypothetical protein
LSSANSHKTYFLCPAIGRTPGLAIELGEFVLKTLPRDVSGQLEHGIVARAAEALGMTPRSLEHLKKRFVGEGLSAAVERKIRLKPPREIQFGGEFEAQLLALACSPAPEGRKRWTVRLLAEKMVELAIVPSVSPMTVCSTLKKLNLNLI